MPPALGNVTEHGPLFSTPLGVHYLPQASTFSVFAQADAVRLRLVHPGTRALAEWALRPVAGTMTLDGAVWSVTLEGDWRGWAYSYEVDRGGATLAGILDPWAKLVRGDTAFVWHDDGTVAPRPAMDPSEAIIYELHIRDFTRHFSSGVRPEWRGKYPGLTQRGTRLDGLATGLDHILELGVNVVQLMPVHSFSMPYSTEYEWGYMPNDFNSPHGGYAAGTELGAPVREFKRLVSALHKTGLRVTLDVVYNHTAERWPTRLRSFMALAPREYFRWVGEGAAAVPSNGSGCGNEFRSDSAMGRRFIVESCKYWVTEFGIDGFRFDLMGLIDAGTMRIVARELRAIDPTILVYGEPWAGGMTPIEVTGKGKQREGGSWGAFNDDFRDGFRGEVFRPKDPGFVTGGESIGRCKLGVVGGVTSWTDSPSECINYLECHDNHTLSDRIALTTLARPDAETPPVSPREREAMNRLGAVALLMSQGIPFLHAGQEFGRSKAGEDNTYNLGDGVNNIDWQGKAERRALFAFYRAMVRLRREHAMFRLKTAHEVCRAVKFLDDDLGLALPRGVMGWMVEDVTGEDSWRAAVVILNGSSEAVEASLPPGDWSVAVVDGVFDVPGVTVSGACALPAHAGAVVWRGR